MPTADNTSAPLPARPAVTSARRVYHSPARQSHAEQTRQRILAAGRSLFAERGYAGTTLEAIAEEAGVSPKTVVAAFASKRGVLVEALDPDALNGPYLEALTRLRAEEDPPRRLQLVATLVRQVYEASAKELDLLYGGRAIAPELAEISATIEERRRQHQRRLLTFLSEHSALHTGLSPDEAADEVWALTSFDLYRMLVLRRGWTADRYEEWIAALLIERLLADRQG